MGTITASISPRQQAGFNRLNASFQDTILYRAFTLLAPLNISVLPVMPGDKATHVHRWPLAATKDPHKIQRWCEANPNFNAAALCSDDSLHVLDSDTPGLVERIERETGVKLSSMLTVESSRDVHIYGAPTPKSIALGNRRHPSLFDFQARGKYVVAPPSIHPSRKIYRFTTPLSLNPWEDAVMEWLGYNSAKTVTIDDTTFETCPAGLEVVDEIKDAFEQYLSDHKVSFSEVGWDSVDNRWAYSIDDGCPFRHVHTNPDSCPLWREFFVFITDDGLPQCKCVHTTCDMCWSKYRDFLIERSKRNFPMQPRPANPGLTVGMMGKMKEASMQDMLLDDFVLPYAHRPDGIVSSNSGHDDFKFRQAVNLLRYHVPISRDELLAKAAAFGISERTLRRAYEEVGVHTVLATGDCHTGHWVVYQ